VGTLKTGWEATQRRAEGAYHEYARALQKAWTAAELNNIDATSMAAIGEHMTAVANYAAGSFQQSQTTHHLSADFDPPSEVEQPIPPTQRK